VVELEDVVCGFRGTTAADAAIPIVHVTRLRAERGDRIGIVGPNGAGKTTLLRTIAGELPALDGFVRTGAAVQPGYLAQIRRASFGGASVLDALLSVARVDTGPARSYLARFLFRGEDVYKPVSELSGGERSRLELAVLGVTAANLLLLDEPTNHLDIPAREALESFLRESPATLLIVSHDRRLLETVCDALWVIEPGTGGRPGQVARFDGGYAAWRAAVADGWTVASELARRQPTRGVVADARRSAVPPSGDGRPSRAAATAPRGAAKTTARPARLSKDAYRRRSAAIEGDLTRLGLRKGQLELALGDPSVHGNYVELRRLTSELADVDTALAQAEEAWLALEEQAPR
jgi:ATP-binding cassette subfamily F protein 3